MLLTAARAILSSTRPSSAAVRQCMYQEYAVLADTAVNNALLHVHVWAGIAHIHTENEYYNHKIHIPGVFMCMYIVELKGQMPWYTE